jgi:hypothetical protein
MSIRNTEVCNCHCHRGPGKAMHPIPCCYKCPFCGKNIIRFFFETHKENCIAKIKKLSELINK